MPNHAAPIPAKFCGWTDREIYGLAQDRLKFDHYAGVLAAIVQEADTPLTLGVFGPWGAGKTSLMRLIKDTLDHTTDKTQFKTVWFDAWTFDKEEALWRALILLVLRAVRKDIPRDNDKALKKLDDLEASLYRDVDRAEVGDVSIDWEKAGFIAAKKVASLSLSLVPGVGSLLVDALGKTTEKVSGEKLDSLFDAVQRKRQEIHRDHVESLEKFQEGFAELLHDHFVGKNKRLVVFIDDLDRCLPEKAISVLEAIKLFIDAPGCVYVIGTDRDVIEQGIRVKYKDFFVGEATATPITGDSYLEKIVQIPFHLPPLQETRIEDFIAQYDESVPPDCAAIFAAGMQPNPRKVKRIINVFRLLRKLAEVRVKEKEIDQFDAGLLAKMIVIQSRWRQLYEDVQEYPNLIQDLERHFRSGEDKAKTPAALERQPAQPTAEIQSNVTVDGSGNTVTILQPEGATAPAPQPQTLLEKHRSIKALGQMLRLPPYFEPLKIDQIQLYLYMTHTVEAEAERKEETFNVDQRRWDDLLSSDPTKVRAAAEAIQADQQAKGYAASLLNVISGKKEFSTPQRVSAGNALGYLGDPRFRADAWFLPDDPLLGFVEIPAGPFLMGSDPQRDPYAQNDEQPQHEVNLPTYYIARYPVTVAQFQTFVTANGYKRQDEKSLRGLPHHPVEMVTWYDAIDYCNWLNETLKNWQGRPQPLADLLYQNQWHITLPSEAEWEKAARGSLPSLVGDGGGTEGGGRVYPWGNDFNPDKANIRETRIGSTSAVGCFPAGASPYGLHDMSGNVWEWTRSLWDKGPDKPDFKYPYDPVDGRENLEAPDDVLRVIRGGSWDLVRSVARVSGRGRGSPDLRLDLQGFRCVLRSIA
jgi:formylglycine-generating enzyme required for sulfatase activity